MVSSLSQNDRDNRDCSSILEGLWRVTDELNELVQYLTSKAQTTPDASFGPVMVVAAHRSSLGAFKT